MYNIYDANIPIYFNTSVKLVFKIANCQCTVKDYKLNSFMEIIDLCFIKIILKVVTSIGIKR